MTAETMLAIRWHARDDVRLDEVSLPPAPSEHEVQIRVLWTGICATDIEEWQRGPIFIPMQPHQLTNQHAPLTLGHEISGEVVATGSNVDDLVIGDRVAVDGLSSCGACDWCRQNRPVLCASLAAVGLMADGGLAEYCNVPAKGCFRIPISLGADVAALAETLAVGVRALARGRFVAGESVCVVGAGAVGLLAMQAARALGASLVSTLEKNPTRRALATQLGADSIGDTANDVPQADVVLECSGNASAAASAITVLKPGGRMVLVGLLSEPLMVDALSIVTGEREIIGSLSHVYDTDFAKAISLLSLGLVNAEPLISHRVKLVDTLTAFAALAAHPADHLKVVVSPRELSS